MDSSIKTIIDAIKPLADKIGQGASALFNIYVRQAYIEGITDLVVGVPTSIIAMIVGYILLKSGWDDWSENHGYEDPGMVRMILGSFLLIIGFITIIYCGVEGIQYLLNPQYQAIQTIISQITGH